MFGVRTWIKAKHSGSGTAHLLVTYGIAGFVALACTVLIGLEVSRVVTQRSAVIADARKETTNLTRSLIQHAELTFRTADAVLIALVERLEHEKPDAAARARLKEWFVREVENSSQFVAFGVIDENGTMVVNLLGEGEPAEFAERDYFLYHRSHNDDALRIGRPVQNQSHGWLIPVTRRFNKADGTFGGVAVGAINPQYFQSMYDRLELGSNSAVVLATTGGTLLVRRPFVEANIGRDMSQSEIVARLKEAPSGSLEMTASIDGAVRFNSYERGRTYPIFVAVGQNMDELLAPWKAAAFRRLVETAAVASLILLMGAFVWRATKNLATNSIELRKTNARFDAALAHMPTGLCMFDADDRLAVWNERYLELYGMSADVICHGVHVYDVVEHRKQVGGLDKDVRTYVSEFLRELREIGKSSSTSRLKNGRIVSVANAAITGGGWVGIHEDITERVGDEEALFNQARELSRINLRFQTALSHMTQGLSMFDERKRLVVWNNRFAELYDVPERFLKVGTSYEEIIADRFERRIVKATDASRAAVDAKVAELSSMATDSHRIDELADGRFLLLSRQPMQGGGWLSIIEDITERRRAEAEIVHLAKHDVLTGLPNRAQFNDKLEEAGKRLKRGGAAVTVMMLDLDRFKAVNDMLGHPAGDELLIEVGRRLKSTLREVDQLARLGGDEFAIIQEGGANQHEAAIALALRITSAISEPFDLSGFEVNIGTSIGIAMAPEHGSEPERLLKSADLALYAAKAQGRNDFCIYQPDMLENATSQQVAESELRDAIAGEQFEMHYQPVVDIQTRQICGVEALLRWRHPVKGLVGPDRFIPLAESNGLIAPIGEWVLQRACADAAKWPDHIKLAINISAMQFKKGNLFELILCALVESGLAPERLELEITETSLLENQEAHLATIRQLKNLGITLALDDFGTGYSSVTYLTNFPFDKIKIDQSFTRDVLERGDYAAVVSSVIALAHGLGMVTTVEGVETEQQFEYVREAGVNLAQGYLFSRPVPASELDFTNRYTPGGQEMVA
jgi:diguanylate cyclase (GGDEF)-like protein/PAS domain S-box-containing protein